MGIIRDRRPRDWGYKAIFTKEDFPALQQMVREIQETHNVDLIEDFNAKCEQKLSLSVSNEVMLNNGIIIKTAIKSEDLVVTVGLDQCIRQILQTSTSRWNYLHLGTTGGASPPNVGDQGLYFDQGGPFPLSLNTYGWSEPRGMRLYFGCLGPQISGASNQPIAPPLGAATINEMGVGTTSQQLGTGSSIMLNHEMFAANPLTRTLTEDLQVFNIPFIFSCVIEFCPVAD